jgi:hypothetical protein
MPCFHLRFATIAAALLGMRSAEPAPGDIVVLSASREVHVSAAAGAQLSTASSNPGLFVANVADSDFALGNFVAVNATQDSTTPIVSGLSLSGVGEAVAAVGVLNPASFTGFASSLFDVTFRVDVDGSYQLDADVTWGNDAPPYAGVARVELTINGTPTTLASLLRFDAFPGAGTLSSAVQLMAGTTYRLQAEALVNGGPAGIGGFSGDAGWSLNLTAPAALPEINSGVMLAPIIVGGFIAARRQSPSAKPRTIDAA